MKKTVQRVHPTLKLLLFLQFGLLPFFFQDPRVLLVLFLFNLLFVSRLGWTPALLRTYLFLGGIGAIFTAASWLPFIDQGTAYWKSQIPLIGLPVQITDTGILWAIGMGLRISNIALLSMFYLFTTTPRQIVMGLKGIGVPYSVGFLISLIFRFIPVVKNDLLIIREAQMVRGLQIEKGSLLSKIGKYGTLMVPLIFTSLKRVQLIANALDAKGFKMKNPKHRFYHMPKWDRRELAILFFATSTTIVLFYMARIHSNHFGVIIPTRI